MKGTFEQYLGHPSTYLFDFLIVTGSFACALAFHNAASRYIYAIGREIPRTSNNLGATHKHHGSPHIASATQSAITLVITILFWTKIGNDVVAGGVHLRVRRAGGAGHDGDPAGAGACARSR